eukprot:s659_g36.t1
MLEKALTQALRPQTQLACKRPCKKTMSESTWALVLQKRTARQHLAQLNERQRLDKLACFFAAWKQRDNFPADLLAQYDQLYCMQDQLIAKALEEFCTLGRIFTAALRQDDVRFFQALLQEGSDFLEPPQVRQFWGVLRRTLPKFRQRKTQIAPSRLEVLEDQMLPHLCELEMGTPIDAEELIQQCHQRQLTAIAALPTDVIQTNCLPTLSKFETSLRATTSHKATGLDPIPSCLHHDQAPTVAKLYYALILKMHLWCTEPIQFKGGIMCLIPKKGNPAAGKKPQTETSKSKTSRAKVVRKVRKTVVKQQTPDADGMFVARKFSSANALKPLPAFGMANGHVNRDAIPRTLILPYSLKLSKKPSLQLVVNKSRQKLKADGKTVVFRGVHREAIRVDLELHPQILGGDTRSFGQCPNSDIFGGDLGNVEQDSSCKAILKQRMQDGLLRPCRIESDVRETNFETVAAEGITAGFPCQARHNVASKS